MLHDPAFQGNQVMRNQYSNALKKELMTYLKKRRIKFESMILPTALVSEKTGKILTCYPSINSSTIVFPVVAKTLRISEPWKETAAETFLAHRKAARRAGQKCFIGLYAVQAVPYYLPNSFIHSYDEHMIRFSVKYY